MKPNKPFNLDYQKNYDKNHRIFRRYKLPLNKNKAMFYRQYYSELGKLLYALAHVEGAVSKKEKEGLKELVRKELLPDEKHQDTFGTDAAYYSEIEFEILEETMTDPESAFESFLFFIEQHHSAIDQRMRAATLKVAKKLAATYHKTNKKEKDLLTRLEYSLKHLPTGLQPANS